MEARRRSISRMVLLLGLAACSTSSVNAADASAEDDSETSAPTRTCERDTDCIDALPSPGKYLCAYPATGASPAHCMNPTKTCIFVSSSGHGVSYMPECGCDGRDVEVNSTWPAAPAPVSSFAACPRDAAGD